MEQIHQQIRRARRRLILNRTIQTVTWTTFLTMLIALLAIVVPKIWPIGLPNTTVWAVAWVVGALVLGVVSGLVWALVRDRGPLDAAIEIDLRYGLKERVSSAVSLSQEERETEAGRALLDDAQRRVSRIDVREHFSPRLNWHPLLPVVTTVLAFSIAFFVHDAQQTAAAKGSTDLEKKQIRQSMAELKKKLAQQKKKAEATGLKDADKLYTKLQRTVNELSSQNVDRKKLLVKLNNLTKELAERRKGVEGSKKTRDLLKQLQKPQSGPAERVADALKKGDMKKAMDELKKLSNALRDNKMSDEEKKQLVKQIQQMQKELENMLGARQELAQKQKELQDQINQLKKEGKNAEAADLQKKMDQMQKQMDQMNEQDPQLKQLQDLAKKFGDAAQDMKEGNNQKAADQLDKLASELQQLQEQMESLEMLSETMSEIADAKSAMNCQECGGKGCAECEGGMGGMGGDQFSETPGRGMGPGNGMGDRPEEETDTGGYRARVAGDPKKGESVRVGDANGPNIAGQTRQQARDEIASEFNENPAPLNHEKLPRREREQTREYFELLRKGD